MWLCYLTMLLYHFIMLKKTLQVFNVPYKQSTVLQQHLQVSLLCFFCQYLPKYWQQEYKKIFKSPKFEGGSATVIENQKHWMVNEKSPKKHIQVLNNFEVSFHSVTVILCNVIITFHKLCTLIQMQTQKLVTITETIAQEALGIMLWELIPRFTAHL